MAKKVCATVCCYNKISTKSVRVPGAYLDCFGTEFQHFWRNRYQRNSQIFRGGEG